MCKAVIARRRAHPASLRAAGVPSRAALRASHDGQPALRARPCRAAPRRSPQGAHAAPHSHLCAKFKHSVGELGRVVRGVHHVRHLRIDGGRRAVRRRHDHRVRHLRRVTARADRARERRGAGGAHTRGARASGRAQHAQGQGMAKGHGHCTRRRPPRPRVRVGDGAPGCAAPRNGPSLAAGARAHAERPASPSRTARGAKAASRQRAARTPRRLGSGGSSVRVRGAARTRQSARPGQPSPRRQARAAGRLRQ